LKSPLAALATTLVIVTAPANVAHAQSPFELDPTVDFSGVWENDRESSMEIVMDEDGRLGGTYTTIIGGPNGQPYSRPLVGQARGDQLVFYVDWSPYSMTAWVGQLLDTYSQGEVLETTWLNTLNVRPDNEKEDGWAGIRNGGSSFRRASPAGSSP